MTWVKICGVTSAADARLVADSGADAIGLNFVPGSKRRIDLERARDILSALSGRLEVVAVVADAADAELVRLRAELGIEWLQLHGAESPERLAPFLPRAYKAVAIADAADVEAARAFGGERLLVDTKVTGALGGTGQSFDWRLAAPLAVERRLIVAGGLKPENVAQAVRALRPYGVDVASGVESSPGVKDPEKVRRFVAQARG